MDMAHKGDDSRAGSISLEPEAGANSQTHLLANNNINNIANGDADQMSTQARRNTMRQRSIR